MAGIGFELKKILKRDSFLSEITAYLYAAMVSSGPWLISVMCLSVLGLYRGFGEASLANEIFRSTVVYTYAFSLVFVGVIQLVATRYLADRFYLGDDKITLTTYFTCVLIILGTGSVLMSFVYMFFHVSFLYKLTSVLLFLIVCLIWLAMIFLSTIKDYISIVLAFAAGAGISIGTALLLARVWGQEGFLIGYTVGQAVTFFWLLARMLVEFEPGKTWDPGLIRYFGKYWDLAIIGVVYNLAIWIDKIVFWLAPDARTIVPYFLTHDMYEGPVFFAYLTIVPTLAIFLIKIETRFYLHYRNYYAKVMDKRPLAHILEEKEMMVIMLKESIREVFIIQGGVTVLCIAFASQLVKAANLIPLQIPLFRICLIGAFLQACLSMAIIVLFYFDLRKKVLAVSLMFLATNWLFSYISTRLGFAFYGYGYCYSCLLSLLFATKLISDSINDLEYITFAKQPLA
ncbi:MAG: exopolysaccharide Pel transporter PelG [Desulfovibrio sp.]|uniref:exopolysaccharide Pel transporter PelG n=1 Tax=Desulfovibrio sp. 7SRBS1 TaxID=3378064 RepID=UPI003B3EC1E1